MYRFDFDRKTPVVVFAFAGRMLDAASIARVAAAAVEGAEPLEDNAYKVPLLRGLVEERLTALAEVG